MLIKTKNPLIVFGDHTRCFKFIDFDFIAGADGIKILEPIDKFNPKCFYYFCLALKFENKGYSRHYQYLEKAIMRIPPLDTQKQIVEILESKFAKIENATNALNLVKKDLVKLKASLLNSAFNGTLLQGNGLLRASPRNDTFSSIIASNEVAKQSTNNTESTPSHLPQDWEVKTLGEITNCGEHTQKQPKDIMGDDWILELEDIKKESGKLLQKIKFKDRQSKSNKIKFNKGDILFGTLRPYLKKIIIAECDGYCSSEIMPFSAGNKITNRYLFYLFLSDFMGNKIAMLTHGTRMPRLGTKKLKDLPIPLPPLDTQKQIVELLEVKFKSIEKLEHFANDSLDKLGKLKVSLLNKAFSGELVC